MVKQIVKDILFLSQKAEKATEKDKYIAQDLLDTLKANKDRCVGLAANMIGYNKAIICISGGIYDFIMINPSITNKKEEYQTEEGEAKRDDENFFYVACWEYQGSDEKAPVLLKEPLVYEAIKVQTRNYKS